MKPANNEYITLRNELLEIKTLLKMLVPKKASIAYLAESTGKSRQAIRNYLLKHFEPEVDYWIEGNKIYVGEHAATHILQRSVA